MSNFTARTRDHVYKVQKYKKSQARKIVIVFFLGVKHALKFYIEQLEVILYRNETERKMAFLFFPIFFLFKMIMSNFTARTRDHVYKIQKYENSQARKIVLVFFPGVKHALKFHIEQLKVILNKNQTENRWEFCLSWSVNCGRFSSFYNFKCSNDFFRF